MNRIEKLQELQRELGILIQTDDLLVVFHHQYNPLQLSVCLRKDSIGVQASDMVTFEYNDSLIEESQGFERTFSQLSVVTRGSKYDLTEVSAILETTKLWLEEEVT